MIRQYLFTEKISSQRVIKTGEQIGLVNGEAYTSLFFFDHDMIDLLSNEKSAANFKGNVYGNYFVLDIDNPNIPELVVSMIPFLNLLKEKDIYYYLFFSGNKGFHVYIPKEYIKYDLEFTSRWNEASRLFAEKIINTFPEMGKYVDLGVYDKVRMFRLPYSIHQKSGKKKELLSYNAFDKDNPIKSFSVLGRKTEDVFSELFEGRDLLPHEVSGQMMEITMPKKEEVTKHTEKSYLEYPYGEKLCIYKILNTYNLTGSRHKVALRLQSYWKEKGYNEMYTSTLLHQWNQSLDEPLPEGDIDVILKSYEKGYIFNCKDEIKRHFCVQSCHLYKMKDVEDNYFYTDSNYIEKYISELNASRDHYIFMHEMYPEWNLAPIKPGHVIVLAGGPGSGKTTLALNMMMFFTHINWLFFSLEMTGVDIVDKLFKVTDTSLDDRDSLSRFRNAIKHIVTIDKPDITAESLKSFVLLTKAKTGNMPTAIMIDYLSLLGSRGHNQTERVIQIAKSIKTLAKEMKLIVFILSQVPKDMAGDGNLPLGLDAPKDSGEIVNLADMLWTCWRPNRNRPQMIDNIFSLGMPKNRHGSAGYVNNFRFIGEKYQILPNLGETNG